ncbi:hypothetical protein IC757_04640 [Wenzhouxiangella sp. AB-CW3]|uniref:hypothetical protein n=1 Tax=Wenzhouxiangella sp. AB-CW3 TaxID=2771012 RepID=UPI00168B6A47|nr:hypothetical protein [Wenzhouxiangella sp. AB-CW3]QOC23435.1 hypothetical protein IC757_04640 [Wenzhouxiangella sp. AB-CW3]
MQRLFLLLGALFCLLTGFRSQAQRSLYWAIGLTVIALVWMYLEDSQNIRHALSVWMGEAVWAYDPESIEWRRSLIRTLVELTVYALMGAVALSGLVLLLMHTGVRHTGGRCLVVGVVVFGVAAAASATRNVGDWYARAGDVLFHWVAATGTVEHDSTRVAFLEDPVGFWFFDFVIEESLELIGAACLCAGLVWIYSNRERLF